MKYFFALLCVLSASIALAEHQIITNEALDEFNNGYMSGHSNKAFAQSPDGAWGWVENRTTIELAKEGALSYCRKYLENGDADCAVININGKWVNP